MTRPHLLAAVAMSTVIAVTSGVQPLATGALGRPAASAAAPAPDQALALSGRILDARGRARSGDEVTLAALRPGRPGWTTHEDLATTVTDDGGRFTLVADSVPAVTGAPNTPKALDLELSHRPPAGGDGLVYPFTALPPVEPAGTWRLQLPPDALRTPNPASPNGFDLTFQTGTGLVTADATGGRRRPVVAAGGSAVVTAPRGSRPRADETTRVIDARPPVPPGLTRARVRTSAATSCPEGYTSSGWASLRVYKWNYVPAKLMIAKDKGKLGFIINRTHETALQVAMVVAGEKYAGGLAGALRNTSELGWRPKVSDNQKRLWKIRWRYQKQRKWCMPPSGTFVVYLDVYKWRARDAPGGNKLVVTRRGFACGNGPRHTEFFGARTSITRNTTVRFSGYFTIAGVRLDARQRTTSRQDFWIKPVGSDAPKACGDDNAPMWASLAREVRY